MIRHRRWPEITLRDHLAVLRSLRAPAGLYSGPVALAEQRIATATGADHAILVNSGTAALEALLIAAGVKPGHEVIVPAVSFSASAMAVLTVGARPVWCDVRPDTGTLDPKRLPELVTADTAAIMPVALHGLVCDSAAIDSVADQYGLRVVWDACQAIGATDHGARVGELGIGAALSLNVSKPLQALEGGVVLTSRADVAEAVRLYACFGEERQRPGPDESRSYWSRYSGTNLRASPLTAGLLLSQLDRLPRFLGTARRNLAILRDGLRDVPGFDLQAVPDGCVQTPWQPRIILGDPLIYDWRGSATEYRDRIISALRARGVSADTWQRYPLPALPAFRRADPHPWTPFAPDSRAEPWHREDFPAAAKLLDLSLSVALHPTPLYVQPPRVMHAYVQAIREVAETMPRVLREPYRPVLPAPPIPGADLAGLSV